jgi:hypothetical protein
LSAFCGPLVEQFRHQKRDIKNRSLRREARMALPWPISAHGDQPISEKPRGTARF